ncbi:MULTISPECIES: hypothetical protein [unclassified Mycolicibacterium]|uniref:hypothetical protein n=1 Tax=unclassified Mycolicibacterium TaxID=2636767 RepID=UPI002ED9BC97
MALGIDQLARLMWPTAPTPSEAGQAEPRLVELDQGVSKGPPVGTPLVVLASSVLIALSLALTLLTMGGAADVLPPGIRTAIVSLVAVTLPGIPAAALLKLPMNGVFGSVAVSTSIASNILLSQANIIGNWHRPYSIQFVLLIASAVATYFLARQWQLNRESVGIATAVAAVRERLAPAGNRVPGIVLLAATIGCFVSAVLRLDTMAVGNLGLIAALGVDYFIGLGLLAVVLVIEYRRAGTDRVMLAVSNVVLIAYITMPVGWADRTAPFVTAYVHQFISDWILRLDALPPPLDARISWAGFFAAAARLTTIGGLGTSGVFLVSASLVFGVLLMFPVYAIGLAVGRTEKLAWLAVTSLTLFNWYQQDYFAPQAVGMQFYATILAVLLWQLRSSTIPELQGGRVHRCLTAWMRTPGRVVGRGPRWTQCVELVLVLIIAALVVAHQLTPLVTIETLIIFSLLGLTRHKLLWVAAGLVFVAWFFYGAYAYWEGHLGGLLADMGGVDQNLNSSVAPKISGDPGYSRMQYLRIGASLLLLGFAAVGWFRLPRNGGHRFLMMLLALSPFGIVVVQSYGGEVAIRCFLYASPMLAALMAMALLPLLQLRLPERFRLLSGVAGVATVFTLAVLVITNRGLNVSFEHTTREELAVSSQVVRQVDPDQLAYWGQGASYGIPKGFDLSDDCVVSARTLADCTASSAVRYAIISDQDKKYLQYRSGVRPETFATAVDILTSEKGFEVVYHSEQVMVLKKRDAPAVTLRWPS